MASNVASIPLVGSLAFVEGCRDGHGRLTRRVSFGSVVSPGKSIDANLSGRRIVRESRLGNRGKMSHEANPSRRLVVRGAGETDLQTLEGVVFEPFKELRGNQSLELPQNRHESLARQRYHVSCESAVNNQINVEYNASYVYHTLFAYFDRDDIALPGLAKYFKEQSEEEREHAERFMKYQNKRGGRVKLLSIVMPEMEFANDVKGDALYAMELTVSLEKLVTEKLYSLHDIAEEVHDLQLAQWIKSEWLTEQIESIKEVSEFVAQLRRIGKDGHGVYYWDRVLLGEDEA